jgi:hypothetical protein
MNSSANPRLKVVMLYVFKVLNTPFFKFGWTEKEDPWDRIQTGFWTNVHPKELCGKLHPENLELIFLFEGDRRLELCMQSIFPPAHGEFWKDEDLDDMIQMLKLIAEELPVPSRPCFLYTQHAEKLSCCTGILHTCYSCGMQFSRFCKLLQHKRDKHEVAGYKCLCGKEFFRKGNLDRHVLKSCKGKRT